MNHQTQTAVVERIRSIPISTTLDFEILYFGEGTCSMPVLRRKRYDGIHESFHEGSS